MKLLTFLMLAVLVIAMVLTVFGVRPVVDFAKDTALKAHEAVTGFMHRQGLMLQAITSTTNNALNAMHGPMAYSHLDDAAVPAAIALSPGFKPRYVKIINVTDRIAYEWFDGMAATDYVKTVAAGTVTLGTDSKLAVVVAVGSQPSITLAASEVLQNKQYRSIAF